MPPRDSAQLADAIWRTLRPSVLAVLDAALAEQQAGEAGEELSPEDEARAAAWAARQRSRTQRAGQGRCCRSAAVKRKA